MEAATDMAPCAVPAFPISLAGLIQSILGPARGRSPRCAVKLRAIDDAALIILASMSTMVFGSAIAIFGSGAFP